MEKHVNKTRIINFQSMKSISQRFGEFLKFQFYAIIRSELS